MTVEGAVRTDGFRFEYDRHDIKVQDLDFRHQTEASVYNNGAYRFDVENCSFRQAMMGVWSYGHDDIVRGCDLHNIYGTGMHLIDDNVVVESNVLRDIAIVPGLGESNWGYFGMRTIGIAPQVRYNDLSRIGYTGLEVKGNAVVEYNRVDQTNYILNDGGGIAFDNADGMVIRKNVITDCLGSLDGAPTEHDNYFSLVNGLYFGNTSIKNSLITENTVSGCGNSGLYADHTMVNINNQITNNVFFNNAKVQARFSDDSNSMGTNAVAPYYIAQYNDVFTGNTMISLTEDQICLEWVHVHTNGTTDFGTFDNNAYYNAYNEQCIQFRDHFNGNIKYHFTLAQWQASKNKDWSSVASPKRWSQYDVTAVTGPDLVQQGTFDSNTNGWTGWPTNGTITRDLTYLDNGALRCYLPDNSQYTEFSVRNSNNTYPVQAGNWYRMQMSIQSDNYGEVRAGVKGVTQLTGLNMVYEKYIPFSPVRRDVEFVFQSGLTDQAFCQLVNSYTLPRYWLDNVHVNQVNTQLLDPMNKHQLLTNLGTTDQSFDLVGCWSDAHGAPYSGSVTVQPYRSLALIKEDDIYCGLSTSTADINGSMTEAIAFPVPIAAGERITFSHVDQAATVQVFDLNGRSVQQERISEGAPGFAVKADLAAGLYTAIISEAGSVRRAKLEVR